MAAAERRGFAEALHADNRNRVLDEWSEAARQASDRFTNEASGSSAPMEQPVGFMEEGFASARGRLRSPAASS